MATCAGCGEPLADGRSVCPSCGFLNRARSGPAEAGAPVEVPADLGPRVPPLGTTSWSTAPAPPAPRRKGSPVALVVILALVAVAIGAVAFLLMGDGDSGSDAATCSAGAEMPDGEEPGGTARVPVEAEGISWTMASEPRADEDDVNVSDGTIGTGRSWMAEVPTAGDEAELVLLASFDGDKASSAESAELFIRNMGGEVVVDAEPQRIGDRCGAVAVGTAPGQRVDGHVHVGLVKSGEQVLLLTYFTNTDDPADGEQGFAELVSSVELP